ncbi:hypothetical protein EWM64_g10430 [Hericium alpestre]|uniref:Uncharacterized protein n=1 Tax=Hericium alpestre TaxID=135208 RepID=A0A4Y9ZG80_9AGAM|nr:hypothetical protein EWM64_g10430 [Hericium alpestre]
MSHRTPYPPIPSRYSGTPSQTNHAASASVAPACRNDPRSSAERVRTFEEEAFLSDTPRMWDIFRPETRPTTYEEGIAVMRTMVDQVKAINAHERFLAEQNRAIAALRARIVYARGRESVAWIAGGDVEAQLVELVHRAPDAEIRRACQGALHAYYKHRRDEEVRVAEALRMVE